MKLKNIFCLGIEFLTLPQYRREGAVISIVNPDSKRCDYDKDLNEIPIDYSIYNRKLFIEFIEFDYEHIEILKERNELDKYKIFSEELALEIIDFVDSIKLNTENLTVHCEAGICRLPAIGHSISELFKISNCYSHVMPDHRFIKDTMEKIYYNRFK